MLRGAIAHYAPTLETQPIDASAERRPLPDDYVYLERDALIDRELLWEYLTRTLVEYVNNKRKRGRGRPPRGVGWTIVGYYPDEPHLAPVEVLKRKRAELGGGVSQRKLGEALGISALTVWRIVVAAGVGWPLPE